MATPFSSLATIIEKIFIVRLRFFLFFFFFFFFLGVGGGGGGLFLFFVVVKRQPESFCHGQLHGYSDEYSPLHRLIGLSMVEKKKKKKEGKTER